MLLRLSVWQHDDHGDDHGSEDVYGIFTCHTDGTVSVGEHCTDDACGMCEVTLANQPQGACYMERARGSNSRCCDCC